MSVPVRIRVRRLATTDPHWPLPAYKTAGAAGADIQAHLPQGALDLPPGARALVPTGFSIEIPSGFEVQVRPRSGLTLEQGIMVINSPGTIDSDYRGEVGVLLMNAGTETVRISHAMRIAQLVVAPAPQASFEAADALSDSLRGKGGFGSTGSGP